MSEPEREPTAEMTVNGQEVQITRDNTELYRHIGRFAMFDHAYTRVDTVPPTGVYIFRESGMYEQFEAWLVANQFPRHDNIQKPAPGDMESYENAVPKEDYDTIPEGWE